MKKSTIIFDCFGVIAGRVLGKWIPDNLGVDFDPSELFDKHDLDEIKEHELLAHLAELVGRDPSIVRKEIDSNFKLNVPLVDFIKQLKQKGYKIVLLSNANHSFFDRYVFVRHPDFKNLFDDIVISSRIKMIKPNPEIFYHALSNNKVKAEEVIFIDDTERHVLAAKGIGIDAIVYRDVAQLKNDLAILGVTA